MVLTDDTKDILEKIIIGVVVGGFGLWEKKKAKQEAKEEKEQEEKNEGTETDSSAHEQIAQIVTGQADGEKVISLLGEISRQQAVDSEYLKLGHRDRARLTSRLECLFNASPDAIIFSDDNGVIIDWNEAATLLLGYPIREALGKPILMIVPPRYHADHLRGLQKWHLTGEGNVIGHGQFALFALHKDGHEIPIWLTLFADTPPGEGERVYVCGWLQKRDEANPSLKVLPPPENNGMGRQEEP